MIHIRPRLRFAHLLVLVLASCSSDDGPAAGPPVAASAPPSTTPAPSSPPPSGPPPSTPPAATPPRRVVFFLGDGMGINVMTAARIYASGEAGSLTMD
ncbi:MAG TPA: hypothetical protein VLW08_11700, partial [Casimicrobiaceae bacterium]|nr:hypothetical protein [Casimicrobiaceae bacterium]